jgi:hypothetical protein
LRAVPVQDGAGFVGGMAIAQDVPGAFDGRVGETLAVFGVRGR